MNRMEQFFPRWKIKTEIIKQLFLSFSIGEKKNDLERSATRVT